MARTDWQAVAGREYRLQEDQTLHTRFFFQPQDHFYHHNLEVLAGMAEELSLRQGIPVCRMFRNRKNQYISDVDGVPSVLMSLPETQERARLSTGATLAEFHRRTVLSDTQYFSESPAGTRTNNWIKRVNAIGKKYAEILQKNETVFFERSFMENFPYFSGCAENAIQLSVDASIDYQNPEAPVIGHFRFSGMDSLYPENPAHWVVDDRSRDLAEWLRVLAWTRSGEDQGKTAELFLDEYEERFPLTEKVIANMFARLLFPLSYLECCERFFSGSAQQDRHLLEETIRMNEEKAGDCEALLAYLTKRYASRLKAPEWLDFHEM